MQGKGRFGLPANDQAVGGESGIADRLAVFEMIVPRVRRPDVSRYGQGTAAGKVLRPQQLLPVEFPLTVEFDHPVPLKVPGREVQSSMMRYRRLFGLCVRTGEQRHDEADCRQKDQQQRGPGASCFYLPHSDLSPAFTSADARSAREFRIPHFHEAPLLRESL